LPRRRQQVRGDGGGDQDRPRAPRRSGGRVAVVLLAEAHVSRARSLHHAHVVHHEQVDLQLRRARPLDALVRCERTRTTLRETRVFYSVALPPPTRREQRFPNCGSRPTGGGSPGSIFDGSRDVSSIIWIPEKSMFFFQNFFLSCKCKTPRGSRSYKD